jgi:hypothetical protein
MLFELNRPLDDLEGMLLSRFAGESCTVDEIFQRHNVDRPYIRKNYKEVLRAMEEKGEVQADPPQGRRPKNTLADKTLITFPK